MSGIEAVEKTVYADGLAKEAVDNMLYADGLAKVGDNKDELQKTL